MLVIKGGIIDGDGDESLISEHLALLTSLTLRNELNGMPRNTSAKKESRHTAWWFNQSAFLPLTQDCSYI